MDILCQKQDATFIYVISADTSDYNSFRSVFNVVNANSTYEPWPVGYERETTNAEYRTLYRDIYENGLTQGFITRTTALNGNAPHTTALIPLCGANGSVKGILCVERPMAELTAARTAYLKGVIRIAVLLCVLSIASIAVFFRHEFVLPMKKINAETRRFAAENTPLPHRSFAEISKIREIAEVGTAIEKMEHDTQKYIQNLTKVTAEKERIGTELALASQIQAEILPNIFPPLSRPSARF